MKEAAGEVQTFIKSPLSEAFFSLGKVLIQRIGKAYVKRVMARFEETKVLRHAAGVGNSNFLSRKMRGSCAVSRRSGMSSYFL